MRRVRDLHAVRRARLPGRAVHAAYCSAYSAPAARAGNDQRVALAGQRRGARTRAAIASHAARCTAPTFRFGSPQSPSSPQHPFRASRIRIAANDHPVCQRSRVTAAPLPAPSPEQIAKRSPSRPSAHQPAAGRRGDPLAAAAGSAADRSSRRRRRRRASTRSAEPSTLPRRAASTEIRNTRRRRPERGDVSARGVRCPMSGDGARAIRAAVRRGHADVHRRLGLRLERGVARPRRAPAAARPGAVPAARDRERDRSAPQRQPPQRLPPERVVRAVGRGQHHPPPPRGLAREDHRASFAVALHRDQRRAARRPARRSPPARWRQAGARRAARRGQRRQRFPSPARVVGGRRELHDRMRFPAAVSVTRFAPRDVRGRGHGAAAADRDKLERQHFFERRVARAPAGRNDRAPSTSRPPPRWPTNARVASSCARVN